MGSSIPRVHKDYETIDLTTVIGFSQIPEQVRHQSITEGFVFNLLVVSNRGLGASTLINALFSAPLVNKARPDSLTTTVNEIVECGIRLTISVTTYHGDDINCVLKMINSANEEYFNMEQGLTVPFPDKRIHCCLYLIPGDRISESEISDVKELSMNVNVIPVITKADMFTSEELTVRREKINNLFREVEFYDYEEQNESTFPPAVIASENVYEENGLVTRGRRYQWGFIDIENEKYSDFKKLQRIIICERFADLICKTDSVYYKNARRSLMKNENAVCSRARLLRILDQMEAAIDERYQEMLRRCEKGEAMQTFEESAALQGNEVGIAPE